MIRPASVGEIATMTRRPWATSPPRQCTVTRSAACSISSTACFLRHRCFSFTRGWCWAFDIYRFMKRRRVVVLLGLRGRAAERAGARRHDCAPAAPGKFSRAPRGLCSIARNALSSPLIPPARNGGAGRGGIRHGPTPQSRP